MVVGRKLGGLDKGIPLEVCGFPLERRLLAKLRLKAQRCSAWFSKLTRDERRLLDLVIKVVDKVRSFILVRVLEPIIRRLLDAMGGAQGALEATVGRVTYLMIQEGQGLAQKLSRIAWSWGNRSAVRWPEDKSFVRYLTVMNLPENRPP